MFVQVKPSEICIKIILVVFGIGFDPQFLVGCEIYSTTCGLKIVSLDKGTSYILRGVKEGRIIRINTTRGGEGGFKNLEKSSRDL